MLSRLTVVRSIIALACCCLFVATSRGDTLRGTVVDEQGAPLEGVRVDITTAAPKVGEGIFCPSCYLDCAKWAKTDGEGRFVIEDLDPSLKFRLIASSPKRTTTTTDLLDPLLSNVRIELAPLPVVEPQYMLHGQVKNEAGAPIEGAVVEPLGYKQGTRSSYGSVKALSAVTDSEGRFIVILQDLFDTVDIEIHAAGYVGQAFPDLAPGERVHPFALSTGTTITGQIVDDGKPIANAPVSIVQTNRFIRRDGSAFLKAVLAYTGQDGRFRFENMPPYEEYVVFSPVGIASRGPTLETHRFAAGGNGQSVDLGTLQRIEGSTLAGRIEMINGGDLPESVRVSLGRNPAWDLIEIPVNEDGTFRIQKLPPEVYDVRLRGPGLIVFETNGDYLINDRDNSVAVPLKESVEDLVLRVQAGKFTPSFLRSVQSRTPEILIPVGDHDVLIDENSSISSATSDPASERPPVELARESVSPASQKISVRGIIVTPEGQPIPNADVYLLPMHDERLVRDLLGSTSPRRIARTKTDEQGWFTLKDVPIPPIYRDAITHLERGEAGARIVAKADGRALTTALVTSLNDSLPLQLTLKEEVDATGTLHDPAGNPIPHQRVTFSFLQEDRWNADPRQERDPNPFSFYSLTGLLPDVTTDEHGTFRIPNLPKNAIIHGNVGGDEFRLVTNDPGFANRDDAQSGLSASVNVTQPFTLTVNPQETLRVRVVDHERNPVTSGKVIVRYGHSHSLLPVNLDGLVEFNVPLHGDLKVGYQVDPFHPQVEAELDVVWNGKDDPMEVQLELPMTRWVTGILVNSADRSPIPGAYLTARNRILRGQGMPAETFESMTITDANGEFRIPVARGLVSFDLTVPLADMDPYGSVTITEAPENMLRASRLVIPEMGDESIDSIELTATRGTVIHGVVRDPDGKPVTDAVVRAEPKTITATPYSRQPPAPIQVRTDTDGRYEFTGLPRRGSIAINAYSHGMSRVEIVEDETPAGSRSPFSFRNWSPDRGRFQPRVPFNREGAQRDTAERTEQQQQENPDQSQQSSALNAAERVVELDLTLQPGGELTGRVLHDGRPVAGLPLRLLRSNSGEQRPTEFAVVKTNDEGRYLFAGLHVGDQYRIELGLGRDQFGKQKWREINRGMSIVRETIANSPWEIPDIVLIGSDQSLSGRVIDLEGNPVTGLRIYSSLADESRDRSNSAPGAQSTEDLDPQGRFWLSDLPAVPLELKVSPGYRAPLSHDPRRPSTASSNRYSPKYRPSFNQQDIEFRIDPTLFEQPPIIETTPK